VAAGEPAAVGLEAHLASCEACREELHVLRRALAMTDAEMAGLLAAEPPPELAVRIRRAVAETSERSPAPADRIRRAVADSNEPSRQRGSVLGDAAAAWRLGWLWPASAAAATLLVALAVVLGRGPGPTPEPRVAIDARPPQSAGGPGGAGSAREAVIPGVDRQSVGRQAEGPVTPRSSIGAGRRGVRSPGGSLGTRQAGVPANEQAFPEAFPWGRQVIAQGDPRSTRVGTRDDNAPTRSRSVSHRGIQAEPEVLVPPGETEALLRFVALVHRERLAPAALAAAGQPSADLAELASIDIQPLEIVPLDPAETSGT
jgi:hypothetical protein